MITYYHSAVHLTSIYYVMYIILLQLYSFFIAIWCTDMMTLWRPYDDPWWPYDDPMMTLWWPYDDPMMTLWRPYDDPWWPYDDPMMIPWWPYDVKKKLSKLTQFLFVCCSIEWLTFQTRSMRTWCPNMKKSQWWCSMMRTMGGTSYLRGKYPLMPCSRQEQKPE